MYVFARKNVRFRAEMRALNPEESLFFRKIHILSYFHQFSINCDPVRSVGKVRASTSHSTKDM